MLSSTLPIDHTSSRFSSDTPSIAIPISMAKTSGAHPLSSPENSTMVTRTRPAKCRTPTAKYLAAYSAASPPPTSQKKKTKKKVTRGELSKEDTPVPPELRKRPPEYNLPTLMPIGEYAASGMLPSLSFDGVPTLPPINPPVGRYPLRNNRTPAATPLRVIGLRSDAFNPLDHTSPHHPLPPGSLPANVAEWLDRHAK